MAVLGVAAAASARDSVSIQELEQRLIFTASSNSSRRGRGSILLKELEGSSSSTANNKVPGAVPFKWEAEPGKPKSPITCSGTSSSSLPSSPLQPPPCLSRDSSRRSTAFQQQVSSQNVSPRSLSEKLGQVLQLKFLEPKPSPSQTKNSILVEHRLSPVSILDHSYAASSGSSGSCSPTTANAKTMTSNISDCSLESPLSSSQFKKQLSLEIWEHSLREQQSSGGGCGFFKQMFGCWQKPKPKESPLREAYGSFQSQNQEQFSVNLENGEFESFQDEEELDNGYDGYEDEDEECMVSDGGIQEEEDMEVHAVKDGEFATLPVSAAFIFSKPALKKSANRGAGQQKRVRFFIEDYSSNEEDGEGDVYDCGTSSDDEQEGFQRPARVVIRRRKRREEKLPDDGFGSYSSPELQPMQVFRL